MSVPELAGGSTGQIGEPLAAGLEPDRATPDDQPLDLAGMLRDLAELGQTVVRDAAAADKVQRTALGKAESEFQERREALLAKFTSAMQAAEVEHQLARAEIATQFDSEQEAAQKELQLELEQAAQEYDAAQSSALSIRKDAVWEAGAVYEATKKGLRERIDEAQRIADAAREQIESLAAAVRVRLLAWRQGRVLLEAGAAQAGKTGGTLAPPASAAAVEIGPRASDATTPAAADSAGAAPAEASDDEDAEWSARIASSEAIQTEPAAATTGPATLAESFAELRQRAAQLDRLSLPRLFEGVRPFVTVGIATAAIGAASWLMFSSVVAVIAICAVVVAALGVAGTWVFRKASRQVLAAYAPLLAAGTHAETLRRRALRAAYRAYGDGKDENKRRRHAATSGAEETCRQRLKESGRQREGRLTCANDRFVGHMSDLTRRRERASRLADDAFQRQSTDLKQQYEIDWHAMQDVFQASVVSTNEAHDRRIHELTERWRNRADRTTRVVGALNDACERLFPDWASPEWSAWRQPLAVPPVVPFGRLRVEPAALLGGEAADPRFPLEPLSIPACLTFPDRGSLLIRARGPGRAAAVEALQAVMLRMLTSMPAGKVRFTIVDPVGLGRNFAAFMHLADYDEQLVASRIWTEASHIEQRLSDLTEQMENIIQKYLRNEFETIAEYNAQAGEIAEPVRVLVVAGFPANFGESAARRLLSIAASGPRCGVYTLLSVDAALALPPGISLADLQAHSVCVAWREGAFVWQEGELEKYPLELAAPPSAEVCTRSIRQAGENARQAQRVEVPFRTVAPPDDAWWTGDSSDGLRVPLGPCGATRRQWLQLGQGTSQHVLIAGKTGSGKSTLLHALVTNLALHYSPDQVRMYLVDFKKGVEFKAYATHALPHASVVAIESDREFGLSVLERLDAELKARGEAYREAGVQDVRGFRQARPQAPLPRIVLVVDEFQEFFTEDDKLAQQAALLLDRLVRQGRAFGVHVLLGSQTLAGAYSLARSTIGQMAVRIALACSEADAHLILSEENTAARLLSRPGEAIYNDAGGLLEGNHPFQVAWLADSDREAYLLRLREMAGREIAAAPTPAIVYEGNVPADLASNALLRELLAADDWPPLAGAPRAWLGEAVAIKDPTCATLGSQSGSHLLLVGQDDTAALGVLAAAVVSLAAQHAPAPACDGPSVGRFVILDAANEGPSATVWQQLRTTLPHAVEIGVRRDLDRIMAELYDETLLRQQDLPEGASTRYIVLHDVGKLRDLRRDEDDFGITRGEPGARPSLSKQLAVILREGASLGMHVLCWCDSLNNLQRMFDRQTLREFEQRVLFQMSAGDSSHLVDSPAASRLGINRALYANEQEGRLEKFRPYAAPAEAWLSRLRETLSRRAGAE